MPKQDASRFTTSVLLIAPFLLVELHLDLGEHFGRGEFPDVGQVLLVRGACRRCARGLRRWPDSIRNAEGALHPRRRSDEKNLADIREFTTPEVFAEIKMQLDEGEGRNQQDRCRESRCGPAWHREPGRWNISPACVSPVSMRENNQAEATPFEEVWNLSKPAEGRGGWLLARHPATAMRTGGRRKPAPFGINVPNFLPLASREPHRIAVIGVAGRIRNCHFATVT